jgi:hypothetical protein
LSEGITAGGNYMKNNELEKHLSAGGFKKPLLCNIQPGPWNTLTKMLRRSGYLPQIPIENGAIVQSIFNNNILSLKLNNGSDSIVSKDVKLNFKMTPASFNELPEVKGNYGVNIYDYTKYSYLITSGNRTVVIPKCNSTLNNITVPDIREEHRVVNTKSLDNANTLREYIEDSNYVDIYVFNKIVGMISVIGKLPYVFEGLALGDYNGKVPDAVFRSYSFLHILGEIVTFDIATINGRSWLHTTTEVVKGKNYIDLYEPLTVRPRSKMKIL